MIQVSDALLGHQIRAEAVQLDSGWDLGIYGGVLTHVGAVTLAAPGENTQTFKRNEHKEALVSEKWAVRLSTALNTPVCVRCGIHYERATAQQLDIIVECCDRLLDEMEQKIRQLINGKGISPRNSC